MSAGDYLGIPKGQIPWAPKVDADLCVGCGHCLEICPNGVFAPNAARGKMEAVQPGNCVVLCDKCAGFCEAGAISFPDKEETKRLVARLLRERQAKPVEREGG